MLNKPNWIIHYVQDRICDICGKYEKKENHIGFAGFVNAHTHGFKDNGHDEMCVVLDIGMKTICTILNDIGFRIREKHEHFDVGLDSSIIQKFNVKFYRSNNSKTLYLLLPDPNGKLPGEIGCQHPYNKQMLYADIIEQENVRSHHD